MTKKDYEKVVEAGVRRMIEEHASKNDIPLPDPIPTKAQPNADV